MEKNKIEVEKKVFVAPELTVHGDVEAITLGFATGSKTDVPLGSPAPNVFS